VAEAPKRIAERMLFNSFEFWGFAALVLALSAGLPRRPQNAVLLAASYVFYAAWDWRFVSLLWFSTVLDYSIGRALGATEAPGRRRALLVASLVGNLGILGFFKYAGFFAESFAALMRALGVEIPPLALRIVLPVGISFYTFQTLAYTIDVYRRSVEPTRSPLDFALYVAFFPQLLAGPIERASRILPQLAVRRRLDAGRFGSGAWLALFGLYKKVVIADNLARLVDPVYAPGSSPTGLETWLATYAFALQVYCDFSGYTDIARGVARMLGVDLVRNFDTPFAATDPLDFWRRWHMSLTSWLRDYVFVPLTRALLRRGTAFEEGAVYLGLFATMTLCGLWHGAAWTFVCFGVFHGLWLCLHRTARALLPPRRPGSRFLDLSWRLCKWAVTFHLVCASFLLFRAQSLERAGELAASLLRDPTAGSAPEWLLPFAVLVTPLAVLEACERRARDPEFVLRLVWPLRAAIHSALMLAILLLGEDGGSPFIYFQF
jgi:D-alanyl-lipoteichoic acid acyltransferase DltB (MBOAT superfamily)